MSSSEERKQLEAQKDYLQKWINRLAEANFLVPDVVKNIERLNWAIDALKNRPKEAEEMLFNFPDALAQGIEHLKANLPLIPEISLEKIV